MSNLKSFISVDRPTTSTQEALEFFGRLRETYPNSEYAQKSVEEMKKIAVGLAEHELLFGGCVLEHEQLWPGLAALYTHRG